MTKILISFECATLNSILEQILVMLMIEEILNQFYSNMKSILSNYFTCQALFHKPSFFFSLKKNKQDDWGGPKETQICLYLL